MGKVIVITSGKGGVGKTTSSANLGAALAMQNQKTLLIDTDIGLRNLDVVMGLENRIVYDLIDVIEGACKPKQAIIKDKRNDNLHLLPAAQSRDKNAISPEQMIELINTLRPEYDYILVDCPAGIEQGFRNAIAGADEAYVVTTPEISAVRDADRIIGLLEANEIRNPKLIINRLRVQMVKDGNMLSVDDVIDILGIKPIGIVP
ncbi:MAG: septum site-determining protein MinD, partial [Fusobacteriaceae bacterium]